jgi:hypothetical protein
MRFRIWLGGWTAVLLLIAACTMPSVAAADSGVGVSIGVGDTLINITGQTSPGAFVTIRDDDVVIGTIVADNSGNFVKIIGAQTPGIHNLSLFARSGSGSVSDSLQLTANLREHDTTAAFVFLPTTITLSGSDISPGTELVAQGETVPSGMVQIYIDQMAPMQVVADSAGSWELHIGPGRLNPGNHSITAYVTDGNSQQSAPTAPRFFTILTSPANPLPITVPADQPPIQTPPHVPSISLPKDNTTAATEQVTVVGLSDAYGQIEVWRNNRLMGSVFADKHGGWYLTILLQSGMNEITSRACRGTECSNFSDVIHVRYDPTESMPTGLRLLLDSYRFDTAVGQNIHLNASVFSGQKPYTYEIDWGDGTDQLISSSDGQTIFAHAYGSVGRYTGTISVKDPSGDGAQSSFSVNVHGSTQNHALWKLVPPGLTVLAVLLIVMQQVRSSLYMSSLKAGMRRIFRRTR